MKNIITYSFCEHFVERLADFIEKHYMQDGKDLSRLAVVFGGKRPALFVKRELARRLKTSFVPPRFFTINDFVTYIVRKKEAFGPIMDLDNSFLLYQLAARETPQLLDGRETFAQFLPWTREILSFIDQLDLEDVRDKDLTMVQANAEIGYAVPDDINELLQSIVDLRGAYHEALNERKLYSRGWQYLRAAQVISEVSFDEFDQVLVCNFFYFHRCEEIIVRNLHERKKATLIFQGDQRKWPILERIAKKFSCQIIEGKEPDVPGLSLQLYKGFDGHSQVCLVREILKKIKRLDKTVIVLPNPDHIIPLLSEIANTVQDFNISMGYPLRRSSLYSLCEFIFKAQLSRKGEEYYARDYLKVLRHPFVKNLILARDSKITRILVHKIEEILTGKENTPFSGRIFIDLEDIESLNELYMLALETLDRMGIDTNRRELCAIVEKIHELFFHNWAKVENFNSFSQVLEEFLDVLTHCSFLKNYPLNLNIATKMYQINNEFKSASFQQEKFSIDEIYRIFDAKISHEIVAFLGSPLKGLQLLGLFETRSLNFENVIMLDVNEGVLPRLNIFEPLIPREVMLGLNLDRLEYEEEIQRYQFMRLISSAQQVHLVYQESKDKEKSRFVEELVWDEQRKTGRLDAIEPCQASFAVKVGSQRTRVKKTPEIISFLKDFRYSASSVNTYLRNPLEFYYSYVLGLRESEDMLDEPEARHVGTFLHELLEHCFYPFLGKKPLIDSAFRKKVMRDFDKRFEESFGRSRCSDSFLLKRVIEERLARFLDHEEDHEDRHVEKILYLENRFQDCIRLSAGEIKFNYIVDRVDQMKDGTVMIIDYKTGSVDLMPSGIERIAQMSLSREAIRDTVCSFQIPLYFHYLDKQFQDRPINAALYNLRTMELKKFVTQKMSHNREDINKAFLRPLDYIMAEILDPSVDFVEDF